MPKKNLFWLTLAAIAALLVSGNWAIADTAADAQASGVASSPSAAEAAKIAQLRAEVAAFRPIKGEINIPEAQAQFHLGPQYYFLDAADARKVLVDLWRNPPDQVNDVLGMILPVDGHWDTTWGAVITYQKTGYVSDTDAATTDYNQFIKQSQDAEADENGQRQKDGYQTTHLVGWAQPPSYDKAGHSMIWARDIQFSGSKEDTLNYDVRVLGRAGVLSINMVDVMSNLPAIREKARQLAAAGSFLPGARYED